MTRTFAGIFSIGMSLMLLTGCSQNEVKRLRYENQLLNQRVAALENELVRQQNLKAGIGYSAPAVPGEAATAAPVAPTGTASAAAGFLATVPMIRGKSVEDAAAILKQNELKVGDVEMAPSDSVAPDAIISTEPPFGSQISKGSAVNLVISSGAGGVNVPSVRGLSKSRAQKALTQAGLTLGSIRFVYSDDQDSGLVVRQDPPAGTKAYTGSAVKLWLATDEEPGD